LKRGKLSMFVIVRRISKGVSGERRELSGSGWGETGKIPS